MDKEFEYVKKLVFNEQKNVFLSGVGGTGKSTILKRIHKYALDKNVNAELCATTGIAAYNIGGITIHRWAGVQTGEQEVHVLIENIYKYKHADTWKSISLLIIDEVSMLGASLFEKLDRIAKSIRQSDEPFGGIQLLLSGDFCQLPPVNDNFIFDTDVWEDLDLDTMELRYPFRYPDRNYFNMLLRIRKGQQTKQDVKILKSRMIIPPSSLNTTYLYSKKNSVEKKNKEELNKLSGQIYEYKAIDGYESINFYLKKNHSVDTNKYFKDIISDLITLKEGAHVMLIKNLDVVKGLTNGARGKVVKCEDKNVIVEFMNGKIENLKYERFEVRDKKYKVYRNQIPLILSYGLTIHKCQGLTLDSCVIDIGKSIFSPGAAYVALSRCKTLEGLYLSDFDEKSLYADKDALEFEDSYEEEKV